MGSIPFGSKKLRTSPISDKYKENVCLSIFLVFLLTEINRCFARKNKISYLKTIYSTGKLYSLWICSRLVRLSRRNLVVTMLYFYPFF